jgi:succinate dehydrogenase hydrophobic anchor subunit
VTLFTIWFTQLPDLLFILLAGVAMAGLFVFIFMKAAMVAEGGRQPLARRMTGPNTRILFALLFVAWAFVFGLGLQLVPSEGANSPYGGIGLIAMFSGFFIVMGLIWSVVGE